MRVDVEAGSAESVDADVLAAPLPSAETLNRSLADLDHKLGGVLARLLDEGEVSGTLKSATLVHLDAGYGVRLIYELVDRLTP